jgi:hypothetical protein
MSGEDIGAESKLKDLQRGDESLRQEAARIVAERKRLGLQGLVSGLQSVIINTEPQMQKRLSASSTD